MSDRNYRRAEELYAKQKNQEEKNKAIDGLISEIEKLSEKIDKFPYYLFSQQFEMRVITAKNKIDKLTEFMQKHKK